MKSLLHNIRFYVRAYQRLEIMNRAASLSFFTFLSIFPLLLILISALQTVGDVKFGREILHFLLESLPYQSDLIQNNIVTLLRKRVSFGAYGVIALIVTSQALFISLEKALNSILHAPKARPFFITRLIFFLWLFAMVASLFLPLIFEFVLAGFQSFGLKIPSLALVLNQMAFVLMAVSMFSSVLLIIPARRLGFSQIITSALVFTVVIGVGKSAFRIITLASLDRYNLVYGSLSTLVLVALWIFYFYNIFLMCVYWAGRNHDPLRNPILNHPL